MIVDVDIKRVDRSHRSELGIAFHDEHGWYEAEIWFPSQFNGMEPITVCGHTELEANTKAVEKLKELRDLLTEAVNERAGA